MAYRFHIGNEPLARQIQRIFQEEIDSASRHLLDPLPDRRDSGIHEARKNIKKLRALLVLIRHCIGNRVYRNENLQLRDVARKLSLLRDAQAMIESLPNLPPTWLPQSAKRALAKKLQHDKQQLFASENVNGILRTAAQELVGSRGSLVLLPVPVDSFDDLRKGLLLTYKAGRKAWKVARAQPTPDNLHALRKRVKQHWYHVRLFGEYALAPLTEREDKLSQLEGLLGDGHNLHVLGQSLPANAVAAVALAEHEGELSRQSLLLAEELYARPTRQMRHRLVSAMSLDGAQAAAV